jgi:hypothetical protein
MWIFARNGFLSIVQPPEHPECLLVRARIENDIQHFFPAARPRTTDGVNYDYRYRVLMQRNDVAAAIAKNVLRINYTNFKGAVRDRRRLPYYTAIWNTSYDMQLDLRG